jgi:hypothetical protein
VTWVVSELRVIGRISKRQHPLVAKGKSIAQH